MPEGDAVIRVQDVVKEFGPLRVLDGVGFDVTRGQTVAIVGRSGSGKSTLLRCIAGLESIQGGAIEVCGHAVGRPGSEARAQLRRDVGMVFQSYNLFPHLTVLDNLTAAPVKVRGLPLKQAREKAMALLERVGLSEKAAQYPAALSGGQQQRVAIARTLAMEPHLILLDEVTSALDPELVGEVLDVVQSLAADGMTMMIVTHEMQFAREVSSRVAFMAAGEIVDLASPADLFGTPKNDRLRAFLGRYQAAHRI